MADGGDRARVVFCVRRRFSRRVSGMLIHRCCRLSQLSGRSSLRPTWLSRDDLKSTLSAPIGVVIRAPDDGGKPTNKEPNHEPNTCECLPCRSCAGDGTRPRRCSTQQRHGDRDGPVTANDRRPWWACGCRTRPDPHSNSRRSEPRQGKRAADGPSAQIDRCAEDGGPPPPSRGGDAQGVGGEYTSRGRRYRGSEPCALNLTFVQWG
jgi:hypothetical protein